MPETCDVADCSNISNNDKGARGLQSVQCYGDDMLEEKQRQKHWVDWVNLHWAKWSLTPNSQAWFENFRPDDFSRHFRILPGQEKRNQQN